MGEAEGIGGDEQGPQTANNQVTEGEAGCERDGWHDSQEYGNMARKLQGCESLAPARVLVALAWIHLDFSLLCDVFFKELHALCRFPAALGTPRTVREPRVARMSLSLEHVSFGYSETPVLTDVSLDLRRGDFLGLLGPNGSGKSTLVKLLAGILQPQSGTIRLRDVPLSSLKRRSIARTIAYVPQESNWIFPFTVREVVSMGRVPFVSGMGYGSFEDEAIVRQSMDQVDIVHLADKPVTAISGGERQRTLLARALAQRPEVLLLDEPNAHLDLTHQVAIFEILRRQNEERAVTIVCVSHDLNLAALFCRSAALLSHTSEPGSSGNSIVASGPVSDVFTSPILEAVFDAPLTIDRHPLVEVPRVTLSPLRPHGVPWPQRWNNHHEDH